MRVKYRHHTGISKEPTKHHGKTGILPAPPRRQRKRLRGTTCLGHGKLLQNHENGAGVEEGQKKVVWVVKEKAHKMVSQVCLQGG